jgi:L1 cell adhesion molecule like protein
MKLWPFKVIASLDEKPMIVVNYKEEENQFAAEEISDPLYLQKCARLQKLTLDQRNDARCCYNYSCLF